MQPTNFIDETAEIGEGAQVWHFAVVLQNVKVGKNCSIGSHAEVGQGTVIGDGSRIGAFVFLPPNSQVGRRVFIAPHVMFCDDKRPWAGNSEYLAQPPRLMDGCSIGAGSVILPGVTIGKAAMIGAGSVVTKDVPDGAVVRGEPARLRSAMNFDVYAEPMRSELMESHLLPV